MPFTLTICSTELMVLWHHARDLLATKMNILGLLKKNFLNIQKNTIMTPHDSSTCQDEPTAQWSEKHRSSSVFVTADKKNK